MRTRMKTKTTTVPKVKTVTKRRTKMMIQSPTMPKLKLPLIKLERIKQTRMRP